MYLRKARDCVDRFAIKRMIINTAMPDYASYANNFKFIFGAKEATAVKCMERYKLSKKRAQGKKAETSMGIPSSHHLLQTLPHFGNLISSHQFLVNQPTKLIMHLWSQNSPIILGLDSKSSSHFITRDKLIIVKYKGRF